MQATHNQRASKLPHFSHSGSDVRYQKPDGLTVVRQIFQIYVNNASQDREKHSP